MKFHPFNIKYVEETESMSIIVHDDITSKNFKNKISYSKFIENKIVRNDKDVVSLLSITIKNKKIFHGDVYLDKQSSKVYIYTLNKRNSANDMISHGFFLLKENKDGNKTQLIFDKNEFVFTEDFIEGDIVYLGNVFVHLKINKQVKDIINNELGTNKNYSLNVLKGGYKRCNSDFYFSTRIYIYFYDKKDIYTNNVSKWMYEPSTLKKKIVQINEENSWEIGIEKQYEMFNRVFGSVFEDTLAVITGVHYKSILNDKEYNLLFNQIDYYRELNDKLDFIKHYKNFFSHYNGKDLFIKSIEFNDQSNEFLFDERPIPYSISNSFHITSDKRSDSYRKELLKII